LILEILYLGASRWNMLTPRDIPLQQKEKPKPAVAAVKTTNGNGNGHGSANGNGGVVLEKDCLEQALPIKTENQVP
jgi:hypothetical protein